MRNCFVIKKDIIFTSKVEKYNYSVYAQYTIIVKKIEKKILNVLKKKIYPFSIFYPKPLYKQLAFKEKTYRLKNVEGTVHKVISLPFHPYLSLKHQKIISIVLIND